MFTIGYTSSTAYSMNLNTGKSRDWDAICIPVGTPFIIKNIEDEKYCTEFNLGNILITKNDFTERDIFNFSKIFRKSAFIVDGWEENVEGYTYGHNWNGWACPYFTKENAMKIVEYMAILIA